MRSARNAALDEINIHILKEGNGYQNWVIGVSEDPRKALFGIHRVSLENAWWIYRPAESIEEAKEILENFKEKGSEIVPGGSGRYVFAYKKSKVTA